MMSSVRPETLFKEEVSRQQLTPLLIHGVDNPLLIHGVDNPLLIHGMDNPLLIHGVNNPC